MVVINVMQGTSRSQDTSWVVLMYVSVTMGSEELWCLQTVLMTHSEGE